MCEGNIMTTKRLELLAPAGSMACLHAAVQAGADAVYLGAEQFNARRGAENFTLDNLREACDYAHLRGVKLYLTVNTAVLPRETKSAMELVRQAYRAGIDAFIVQDIGIAAEIKRTLPGARVHASTQMNTHSASGIEAVAALGVKRATLARELSLTEIEHLANSAHEAGLEIEAFAHGALCVCYSGQCFMSSMVGGRSANRGMCAQACRLPYELHNRALHKSKALEAPGEHLLSPKDLCTINLLGVLAAIGVDSLKIEGRMKSPEYVHTVVSVYRAVLDRVYAHGEPDPSVRASEEEMQALSEAFSRGFTTAYLEGERGNDIMSYGRPNNRGVFVGRVSFARGREVSVDAAEELHEGDVLEFWTSKGHFTHVLADYTFDRNGHVRFEASQRANRGDRVFRVRNAAAAFQDDPSLPKIAVSGSVKLEIGSPLLVAFWTEEGVRAEAEGAVVEPARTKPVDEEEVREHVDRMGATPFLLKELSVELDDGVGIGFSQLHKIRARALKNLEEELLSSYRSRTLERMPKPDFLPHHWRSAATVVALATNPACARAARKAGATAVYVPVLNYKRGEAVVAGQLSSTVEQAGYPKDVIFALPTVNHDAVTGAREEAVGFDAWTPLKEGRPVLVENYGQLFEANNRGMLPEVGPHLPVLNKLALEAATRAGARRVWLSPELTLAQIKELGEDAPVDLGLTVIGQTELMVTEHCLLMSQGPCNEDCKSCARRKSPHYLKDRKGYEMPVVTDCCGRSHLYNAVQMDVAHLLPELLTAGISTFMVDTTLMNVSETTEAVKRAVRACELAVKGTGAVSKKEGATSGHLFRGVQ